MPGKPHLVKDQLLVIISNLYSVGTSYNLWRDHQQRILKCIHGPHTSITIVHVFFSVHFPSSPITKDPKPVRKLSVSLLCSLCIR